MTGYNAGTAKGRVAANEVDTIFRPRTPLPVRGVVLCHGAGAPTEYTDLATQAASVRLAAAIASAGFPCVAGEFAGDSWGNATAMARIDSARALLASTFPNMLTDKVLLLGVSMGGAVSVRYSQTKPAEVAGVVGIIPAFNIRHLWENVAAVRASIGAAWGVAYPAALPAAADTLANAGLAADVPLLAGYSSVDTTVPPAATTSYADAVGGTASIIDTASGHSDATVGKMPVEDVLNFLWLHARPA